MAHTSGPWKVSPLVHGTVISEVPIDTGGVDVGHNYKEYYGGYCVAESIFRDADKNLIAAAPEMYFALCEVLKYQNDEIHRLDIWDLVENALKKAKGENK